MTLDLIPPANFKHAGQLSGQYDTCDPRKQPVDELCLDLRNCNFVRPAAALWCMVYLSLARHTGSRCALLVPQNFGVSLYLKSLGLFDALKTRGVDVDDRGLNPRENEKVVLPITHFETSADATNLTNRAFENLQSSGFGAPGLTSMVTELFSELALNAAQHSESQVGSFASIQFSEFKYGSRFNCTVADGGIGVLTSLRRSETLRSRVRYDWDALELAVRERVSGTGDPNRGIGLYGISEDVRRPQGSLQLHSGLGSLEITEDLQSSARRTRLFPGTLAHLSIPA